MQRSVVGPGGHQAASRVERQGRRAHAAVAPDVDREQRLPREGLRQHDSAVVARGRQHHVGVVKADRDHAALVRAEAAVCAPSAIAGAPELHRRAAGRKAPRIHPEPGREGQRSASTALKSSGGKNLATLAWLHMRAYNTLSAHMRACSSKNERSSNENKR
eukprot:scaffold7953_cov220-Pinguiococcus_pyrenoidosus.AAC.3